MLAFTAAALMSAASITGYAAGSPTYDDNLILPNPASTPTTGPVVLVPVNYTKAKVKHDNHEQLTKAESKWLHSKDKHNYADYFRTHSLGRVHGFEVAFNWNGENRNKNEYEFFDMPK